MRTIERAHEFVRPQPRAVVVELAWLDETAFGAHVGFEERLEDPPRLGAAGDHQQAALEDRDLRGLCDLDPDLERTLRAPPAIPRLLAGHSDEAEVPDRRAVGLRVPVDHNDALCAPGGSERVSQAANA
jgi:hypothetical protein